MVMTKSKLVSKAREGRRKGKIQPKLSGAERRKSTRYRVKMQVDYSCGENFLFSYIDNISDLGIFISTIKPLRAGTPLVLRFTPQDASSPFEVKGEVVWINPYHKDGENLNPGMGVKFIDLTEQQKQRIQQLITTIAYIHENWI